MHKVGSSIAASALVFACTMTSVPPAQAGPLALGLRLGPLHFGLPLPGIFGPRRHGTRIGHRGRRTRSDAVAARPAEQEVGRTVTSEAPAHVPAMLYPTLGFAPIYAGIFSPAATAWP